MLSTNSGAVAGSTSDVGAYCLVKGACRRTSGALYTSASVNALKGAEMDLAGSASGAITDLSPTSVHKCISGALVYSGVLVHSGAT